MVPNFKYDGKAGEVYLLTKLRLNLLQGHNSTWNKYEEKSLLLCLIKEKLTYSFWVNISVPCLWHTYRAQIPIYFEFMGGTHLNPQDCQFLFWQKCKIFKSSTHISILYKQNKYVHTKKWGGNSKFNKVL